MAENDDRRDRTLPVTGEVGSEGGSYADPTTQVATFEGDIARGPGAGGLSSSATQATRRQEIAGPAGTSEHAADGIVRYPTEPPHPPSATEGRRVGGVDWKAGLVGAAAGAAVALAASSLRSRARTRRAVADAGDCETVVIAAVSPPPVL